MMWIIAIRFTGHETVVAHGPYHRISTAVADGHTLVENMTGAYFTVVELFHPPTVEPPHTDVTPIGSQDHTEIGSQDYIDPSVMR